MTGSQEPSLLDYARFHGIAIDHRAVAPLDQVPPPHSSINDGFADPSDVPSIDPPVVHHSLEQELRSEKLDIPKDAARFLSSLLRTASANPSGIDRDSFFSEPHRNKHLKLEVPLLKRNWGPATSLGCAERIALDPVKLQLPRENVSDEQDEGLAFPKKYFDLSDSIWKEVSTERLDCSRDDLELLQRIQGVEKPDSGYILEKVSESQHGSNRPCMRHLSPVFLLQRTYDSIRVDSRLTSNASSASSPNITSDTRDTVDMPLSKEYGTIEISSSGNGVMRTEIKEPTSPGSRIYGDRLTDAEGIEDTNTEVPSGLFLVEYDYEETGYVSPKTHHYIPDPHMDDPPSEPNTAGEMLDDYIGGFSTPLFESLGTPTNPFLEEDVPEQRPETNDPADIDIARTPLISQTENQTKSHDGEYPSSLEVSKSDRQGLLLSDPHRSALIIAGNHFPSSDCADTIAELPLAEMICTEKSPVQIVSLDKPPDIDCGSNGEIQTERNPSKARRKFKKTRPKKSHKHTQQPSEDPERSGAVMSLSSSAFSALGSLSSFMKLRGVTSKRRKTEQSRYFPTESSQNEELVDSDLTKHPQEDFKPRRAHDKLNITFPDTPPSALVTRSLVLVLSTSLLRTHRHIVRVLESLTPSPTLIFRDYELPGPLKPNTSVGNASAILLESDIILSPTTGIILTTAQATTQLYLPGHKRHVSADGIPSLDSPLRERIARLSLRYDHIYVFICHAPNLTMDSSATSPSLTVDPKALSSVQSLMAFCSSLSDSSVIPLVIPSVQNMILEWIIALSNKHEYSLQNFKETGRKFTPIKKAEYQSIFESFQDVTPWELFLRRAGLNAFAALAVLELIYRQKLLEDTEVSGLVEIRDRAPRGLSYFIEMDPDLRRQLFEPIIGKRAVDTVERAFEKEWHFEECGIDF
ncbi:hypothetical protein Plec18170_005717 [Paecilomyces lecythidis]